MGGQQSGIAQHHLKKAGNSKKNNEGVNQSEQTMNDGIEDNTFVQANKQQNQSQSRRKQSQLKPSVIASKKTAYERIEASIPLQIMDIREYEGRLKKLIYGKESISLRQLTYVFARDYEDFEELTNNDSVLTKIMTSNAFKQNPNDHNNDTNDQEHQEMNIQYLMLFGLLYCQGTNEVKAKCLYDILQDGLQDQIAASDKDLKDCFWRLLEMASVVIHQWSQDYGDEEVKQIGVDQMFQKEGASQEQQEKWQQTIENVQEQFLDQVFDIHTRIKREDFIQFVSKKGSYLFKPQEIRKKLKEEYLKL